MVEKLGEVIMKQGESSGSRKAKKIRKGAGRWFFALSRILGIGIILFIGMFALDVFSGEGFSFQELLGFLVHLIPSYILIIVLLVAWNYELLGLLLYLGLGISYYLLTGGKEHFSAYLFISGSLTIIGLLFLLDWIYQRREAGH